MTTYSRSEERIRREIKAVLLSASVEPAQREELLPGLVLMTLRPGAPPVVEARGETYRLGAKRRLIIRSLANN